MHSRHVRRVYTIVMAMMIILSPLTSLFPWKGMETVIGENGENSLTPVTTITGPEEGNNFGWNVSWVGDVNGDGFDDIIAGAPYTDRYIGGDWWNTGWSYRKKLAFDNSGQTEDLVNFPVLVNLSSSNFDYSKAKSDGTDLRFIDEDGVTELKYHIEDWNFSGSSYVWVNFTNIAGGSSSDHIWMYYGNSGALDVQDEEGTYDRNFIMVQHLHETSKTSGTYNDHHDSTSNDNDGEAEMEEANMDNTGRIDGADEFDGSNDYVDCGNDDSLNIGNTVGFSITAWIYPKELDDSQFWDNVLFSKFQDDNNRFYFRLRDEDQMQFYSVVGGSAYTAWGILDTGYDFTKDSWYMISWIIDRTEGANGALKVYHNENLAGTFSFDQDISGVDFSNTGDGWIGAHDDFGTTKWLFNGTIDEVRISNTARSSDWIKAQYLSMNNNFITYGNEETKDWWDTGWSFRKKLLFDNSGQSEDLENFPIMVNLSSSNFDYSKVKLDGTDLRFIDDDGITQLNYEVESWDSSDNSYVWVNVTNIAAGSSTDFVWMYYGNTNANDGSNPEDVWDSNYVGVWHLAELSGNALDSTSYGTVGIPSGGVTQGTTGKIDGSYDFNGINGNVNMGDPVDGHLDFGTQSFTISCWANIDQNTGTWQSLLYKGGGSVSTKGYLFETVEDGSRVYVSLSDGSSTEISETVNIAFDTWFYLTGVINRTGNLLHVYKDGSEVGFPVVISAIGNLDTTAALQLSFTNYPGNVIIDEVRISNIARSADWIKAQYLSMNNSFIIYGGEESLSEDCGAAYIFFGYPGITSNNINAANANVTIYGSYANDLFGWSVSDAGDVNGDSKDDIIIGAPHYEDNKISIIWGSSDKQINQNSDNANQRYPDVAINLSGDIIVVWQDERNGGADDDIYAQRFDSNGNPLWGSSDKKVNQYSGSSLQYNPSVGLDSEGNAIIVWYENRNTNWDIYAQKLDVDGNPLWGSSDVKVNQNSDSVNQQYSDVTVDSNGNAIVVWRDYRNGNSDLYAQNLNPNGVAQWGSSDVKVNQNADSAEQQTAAIAVDSAGNAYVVWYDNRNGNSDIIAQKIDITGTVEWGSTDLKVNQNSDSSSQNFPEVSVDPDGNVIVVWRDYRNGNNDIYAQKLDSSGVALWDSSDKKVNQNADSAGQSEPAVAIDSDGNAIVVWLDGRNGNDDIYTQKLDLNGDAKLGSTDMKVNQCPSTDNQYEPVVVVDSSGNAIVVWYEWRAVMADIFAQKLDFTGTKGQAYVFYGRATESWSGIDDAETDADVKLIGENYGDKFGCSVSGAGNVNNDDYDDVIVGAYGYDNNRGRAYILYGPDFEMRGIPYSYAENIGMVELVDTASYLDYLTLTVTPTLTTNYLIIATSDMGPDGTSPAAGDMTSLRLRIGDDDSKIYHEVIRQFEDPTDWYHFSAVKYLTLSAGSHDIELEYMTQGDTGTFRNTRIIAIEMTIPSNQYTENDNTVTSSGNPAPEITAATMTFTPSSAGEYLIIATANVFHDDVKDSAWGRLYIDSTVYGEMLIQPDDTLESINFGVMKNITLAASSHTINLTVQNDDADFTTASMKNARLVAIRLDTFSEYHYNEADSQNNGAGTWETLVTNTYTPINGGDFIILGTAEWHTSDNTAVCGIRMRTEGITRQESRVENEDPADIHITFGMDKRRLSGSQSDKMDHNVLASGWSKFARLIALPVGMSYVTLTGEKSNDKFGFSVSNADRVNNDNYYDVIVGAPGGDRAYIFTGANRMNDFIGATAADVTLDGEPNTDFGYSVAGCGNINNLHNDDVIVGAPGYNADRGRAYIFYGMGYNDIITANDNEDTVTIINGSIDVNWEPKSTKNVGDIPYSVYVGDANNDGYNDILSADWGGGTVTIYNGTSNGGWESKFNLSVEGSPVSVFVGDANNDGINDIITADDNTVTIFNGTSNGSWEPKFKLSVGNAPLSVFVGDANSDGINDILTADSNDNTVTIYNGTSSGGWEPKFNLGVGGGPNIVFVGDANNDGLNDIVVSNWNDNTVSIYNGTSNGEWEPEGTLSVGNSPRCVFVGDANNDGYNDVLTVDFSDDTITIYNGTGSGGWEAKGTLSAGDGPRYLFVGDANNDGYNDIVTADNSDDTITIYNGTITNDWGSKGTLSAGDSPISIFVGDANNDGYNDILTADYSDDTVTIYASSSYIGWEANTTKSAGNNPMSVFVGDANNDGYNDILIANFVNGDGTVNIYNGTSNGNWEANFTLSVGNGPLNVFVGDANNDGYNDILTSDWYDDTVTIYNGTSNNDWEPKFTLSVGNGPRFVYIGDANNDGYNDIVTSDYYDDTVTIYNGTSSGGWEPKFSLNVGNDPVSVFIGDANNDGLNDIITADNGDDTVTIYNGTSGGSWDAKFYLSVGNAPQSVFVGDANNDGYNDIVTVDYYDNTVTIYNGTSSGGWEAKFNLTVGTDPRSVFVGDANNDGLNDIVTADNGDNTVTIYNGTSSQSWDTKYTLHVGAGPYSVFIANANNDLMGGSKSARNADLILTGESIGDKFGYSVNDAGDLNGDGIPDVIVGAPFYDDGAKIDAGAIYVFKGGAPMDSAVDWSYKGEYSNDHFGWSVSFAGDVNDDGLLDLFVGAPNNDDGGTDSGKAYLLSPLSSEPVITNVAATPNIQNIGGYVNITCSVTAFSGVDSVWVNITLPDEKFTNMSMTQGIGNQWFYNNNYTTTGLYQYVIWANDTFGNWTESDIFQFQVVNILPSLSSPQVNPLEGNIHTGFNFTVIYIDLDNHAPNNIMVNITGIGVYGLVELNHLDFDYTDGKEYYINVSGFSIGSHSFHFAANDSIGDWTESNTLLFEVFGNAPMLSIAQVDPLIGDMDTWFNFTVVYIHLDNLAPDIICLNITGIGIYTLNEVDPLDIDSSDGKDYYYNSTGFDIGQYSFHFAARDTIGNWNESGILQFDVINRDPTLSFGQVTPDNGYIDTEFNFTVTYSDLDNHIPGIVTVNITGIGAYSLCELDPLDTDFTDGKDYYLNLLGFALGTYNFHFATNDSYGVWVETGILQIEVINRAPILSLEQVDPIIGYIDTCYNFTMRYTDLDNHSPNTITVNISGIGVYDLLEVDLFDTDYTDGKEYYINLSGFSIGSYSFHFAANDTVGNWIETGVSQFYVINRDPVLSNVLVNPTMGYIDTWFNFTVTYTDLDDHAPDPISVNITGVGVYDLMEAEPSDTSYYDGKEYYYNLSGFALGSYSFNFVANDTIGNGTMSGILIFNVINRAPVLSFGQINPSIGNIDSWFNFSVIYSDLDNHTTASITVNITGIGVYDLLEANPFDTNHIDGKEYYLNMSGFDVGQYSLHFATEDIIGYWDESSVLQFTVLNRAPTLTMENVAPITGIYGTAFNFSVNYTDLDNHAPDVITLNITGLGKIDMCEANISDTNYVDGKEYYYTVILNAGTYSFHFAANDSLGMWALETPEINAPEVQPKHCSLYAIDGIEIYGNDVQLNARLLDDDFNPIQGENVAFYIDLNKNGIYKTGELIDEDATLSDGRIFVTFTTQLPVGNYNFTVIYIGSENFIVENDEAILTIDPKPATLTACINIEEVGETTNLNAELTDIDGNPIENEQVIFYLDKNRNGIFEGSEFIVSTVTSAGGIASINYYINLTPDSYGFWAKYAGSGNYVVNEIHGLLTVSDTGNKPPMILWIVSNQIRPEDSPPWTLNLSSYEADVEDSGPDLKWYITGINTSIYSVTGMNSSNDVLRFIPVENAYGNDEVVLWLVDSSGGIASQILWVNITPVNDPPYFSPLPPDLYMHYDDPSTSEDDPVPWDYTFYIHDVETPIENLMLTTSEPSVDQGKGYAEVDGLMIAYHYPHNRIGDSILVTLRLSDGTDTTQTVIKINVTSNWVPELVKKLPDIVIEENTTLYSVFDLDDYFTDKDMDSLFFSSGYFHIIIKINENNTVDITAQENWAGTEYVTFRARDPTGAIAEDTINVTVIPINDAPIISGVPDLVVHFDYSYAFDLSPYIFDPDNTSADLLVWTSESTNYIWLSQYNNLGLVINYPKTMNGTTIPITIYVSDGLKMAYQTINVTITDNFPPELKYELPDVFFDEDTNLIGAFVLSDYFSDIDSEVLYYTNGTRFINVTINDDLSVDFSAPENWYGQEIVTFRATDPVGALAEDKILVVVVPINDAPTIKQIPRQNKKEGDQWILDISQYIYDVDNDISELTIVVENMVGGEYVILVGNILVFQYPEGIREDMITITISDGELEASSSFAVNLRSSEPVAVTIWDLIPWGWVSLITFIALGGAFAFYKKRSRYSVIEAFLIHKNGLPIAHVSQEEKSELEEVVVSGMFTAVQDFINDTFSDQESEDDWKLDEMKFGEHKILIERSQNLYLAAIFEGYSGKLKNHLKKVLGEINENYGTIFENWDGEMDQLIGIKGMMAGLILKKSEKIPKSDDLSAQIQLTSAEEFEGSSTKENIIVEVKEEKLYETLEEVEKDFLKIMCEEKEKIAEEEELEVVEIEVFDCPVCGKEIEGRLDKCPRCGVIFVDIEDMGPHPP